MTTWYFDEDGDGYGAGDAATEACSITGDLVDNDSDCDDTDAGTFPGADEYCDSVDNDCDDEIDEDPVDPSTFYVDVDGDGHGTDDATTTACDLPDGYSDDADDCDDGDAELSPSAAEVCDDADNDCDGDVDEDVLETFYLDSDGDGYGAEFGDTMEGCSADFGYVADGTDCDDGDDSIYPSADEYCDTKDNDCDGDVDEPGVVDGTVYYADVDEDGYGDASSDIESCDPVSGYVEDDTDCDDTSAEVSPAGVEVCDGLDNDCNSLIDDGASDTWYYDGDGDGFGIDTDTIETCDPPADYAAESGDCDDTEIFLSPGEPEICDGMDNNCDGVVDEDEATLGAHPDCPADDCDDVETERAGITDGTFFLTDSTGEVYADECDFDNPLETVPDWVTDVRPILSMNCETCHDASAPGGLDLTAARWGRLVNRPSVDLPSMDRVEPNSASNSYLWHKIMGTHVSVGGSGSGMPSGGGFMPDADKQIITDWINSGATP
jgi:hypothetical protein